MRLHEESSVGKFSLSSTKAPETDMPRPGFEPPTSCTAGRHSSNELSGQLTLFAFQNHHNIQNSNLSASSYKYAVYRGSVGNVMFFITEVQLYRC